jgi:hypothetical protein
MMSRRRRRREEQAANQQAEWERKVTLDALRHHADEYPGAVVEVASDLMVDLSDEPGHVQSVVTDSAGPGRKRVRVSYLTYGLASDVSAKVDGERLPAGAMTAEDAAGFAGSSHVEFIASEPREGLDALMDRVERYIRERWVPDLDERPRVLGQMGDGDE